MAYLGTPSATKEIINKYSFAFQKKFGQNFLIDSNVLESIIRGNLTLTNNVVIAETTVLKRGKCTCLQSRSYSFNLEEYFKRIKGECNSNRNNQYCRYAG